jgi:8-oxo-dGTP pyrophosphatase MutT (NUDIX family)
VPGAQRIPRPPSAKPAGPAPWEALDPRARRGIGIARVRRAVEAHDPRIPDFAFPAEIPGADPRPAAVLVALFEEDGETRVVLTRRSSNMRSHTGEVSFPGGRLEPGEEAVAAALREATEEVGLDPTVIDIIGQLGPLMTMSNSSLITPFVGVLPARPVLHPNPHEVELAFDVSLAELAADGVFTGEMWSFAGIEDHPVYFFDLPHDIVWGATARVLHELLMLVIGPLIGPPTGPIVGPLMGPGPMPA